MPVLRYKVSAKLTMEERDREPYLEQPFSPGLIGYQLIAGLCIAYVTPETCAQGIEAGIIEPFAEPLPELTYRRMRMEIGVAVHDRLSGALAQCGVNRLKRRLERINAGPTQVTVSVYETEWYRDHQRLESPGLTLMERIKVDMARMMILSYENFLPENASFPFPLFAGVKTYRGFLERLAQKQCVEFMNSGDLFARFQENDFYDIDRFDQKIYKLVFDFDREWSEQEAASALSMEEAQRQERRSRDMRERLKALLETAEYIRRPDGESAVGAPEQQAAAEALRQEADAFLARYPDHHLYDISDQGALDYAALARKYVAALRQGNPAVMRGVAHRPEPFSHMGDHIILLSAALPWLLSPDNHDSGEEWQETQKLAHTAFTNCYFVRQQAVRASRFALFHHWALIDLPERHTLEKEWMDLLEFTEERLLASEDPT